MNYVDKLTVGTKVEISLLRDASEKSVSKSYVTVIEDVFENNQLLMYVPISYGSLVRLDTRVDYSMMFITDSGMVKFSAKIIKYINEGAFNFMLVELTSDGVKVQRREFFRYRCSIPFKFETLSENETEESYEKDKDLLLSYGIIEDIGGGGIKFVSNEELEVDDKIKCLIVLGDNYIVSLGRVITAELSPNTSYKREYRLEFADMKMSDKDIIVKYIFGEQRKAAKRLSHME